MSDIRHFVLRPEPHSSRRLAAAHCALAPDGTSVIFNPDPKRTLDQSAKFHSICGDIARSGIEWAGKPRTAAQWKVLLVSGHAIATNEGAEMVPGIESEFVNLRESTALMSKRRSSSLIEYSIAFAVGKDVVLRDYQAHGEPG